MSSTQRLRTRLLLTQDQMAQFLGVSRVMLAQCETGRKSLPTPAFLRVARLEIALHELGKKEERFQAVDSLLSNPLDKFPSSLTPALRLHATKTKLLQHELIQMCSKQLVLKQQLLATEQVMQQTDPADEKELLYWQMLHLLLSSQHSRYDENKQRPLKATILGRMMEYEVLNEGL